MDTKQTKIHLLESKKTLKDRLISLGNMEIHLPEVPLFKSVRRFISSKFQRLPEVREGEKNYTPLYQDNSELEASSRRHDIGGSVADFTKRIWDAIQKPRSVDGSLRKHTLRTRQDEDFQRKQEEISKRNIRLTRISRTDGWTIDIVKMLQQWENFCYMNLRFPETRKDKVSLEYFLGYQNGSLWVIESLRKEIYNAVISLQRENATVNKNKSK